MPECYQTTAVYDAGPVRTWLGSSAEADEEVSCSLAWVPQKKKYQYTGISPNTNSRRIGIEEPNPKEYPRFYEYVEALLFVGYGSVEGSWPDVNRNPTTRPEHTRLGAAGSTVGGQVPEAKQLLGKRTVPVARELPTKAANPHSRRINHLRSLVSGEGG